jgi:hypothetical protein
MDAARQTCWAAPVQKALQRLGESVDMWRTIYFWMGLLLARYLFRRRIVEIDLNRLRSSGF